MKYKYVWGVLSLLVMTFGLLVAFQASGQLDTIDMIFIMSLLITISIPVLSRDSWNK
jgi:uncharacterized membrane protein